jgi:hypothetical protein
MNARFLEISPSAKHFFSFFFVVDTFFFDTVNAVTLSCYSLSHLAALSHGAAILSPAVAAVGLCHQRARQGSSSKRILLADAWRKITL